MILIIFYIEIKINNNYSCNTQYTLTFVCYATRLPCYSTLNSESEKIKLQQIIR